MQRTYLGRISCSLARTVDIVGEWWTPLILRDLFAGVTRFEDLRRDLGVASNVLSDRLATLAEHGIVTRRQYHEAPTRWEYVLTDKGRDLFPVIATLLGWGDRWKAGSAGPPAVLQHNACGHPASPTLVCGHCGGALSSENVTAVAGPGGRIGPGTAVIGPLLAERAQSALTTRPTRARGRARRERGAATSGARLAPPRERSRRR